MRIGIDFDNTLVCYDEAFHRIAQQEKLLPAQFADASKLAVRAAVVALPNGQYEWERLQGLAYGRLITHARLFQGVEEFLQKASEQGAEVMVVSHKTELAHHDPLKTNLRTAALGFLEDKAFFERLGLKREQVFFAHTREEKIAKITSLKCDIFIDDLPDVLLDPHFPTNTKKIYFSQVPHAGLEAIASWKAIQATVFA